MVLKDQNFTDKLYGPCVLAIWLMDYEPEPLSNGPWCVMTGTLSSVTHSEAETSAQCSHKRSQISSRTQLFPAKSLKERRPMGDSNP